MQKIISLLLTYTLLVPFAVLTTLPEVRAMKQDEENNTPLPGSHLSCKAKDIQDSIGRVQNVFFKQYAPNSLLLKQEDTDIGQVMTQDNNVFISFRGSQGGEELLKSVKKNPLYDLSSSNSGLNLKGRGHKGYCEDFDSFFPSVYPNIIEYLLDPEKRLSLNDLTLFFEGSSAGGAMATLWAAAFKGSELFSNNKVYVFTYAMAHIFDGTGVTSYNNLIGKDNHLNLWAEEDLIARYPDIFSESIGHSIQFRAQELSGYGKRVEEKAYTNMMEAPKAIIKNLGLFNPFITPFLGKLGLPLHLLTPPVWEAHVDQTYAEWAQKKALKYFGK